MSCAVNFRFIVILVGLCNGFDAGEKIGRKDSHSLGYATVNLLLHSSSSFMLSSASSMLHRDLAHNGVWMVPSSSSNAVIMTCALMRLLVFSP